MFHLEMITPKMKVSQHWREKPRWKDQVCPLVGCLAILRNSPAPGMYFIDANLENYAQVYGSEAASETVSRVGTPPAVPPPASVIIERFKDYGYPKSRLSQSHGSHSVLKSMFSKTVTRPSAYSCATTRASLAGKMATHAITLNAPTTMFDRALIRSRDLQLVPQYFSKTSNSLQSPDITITIVLSSAIST
jgi:hypothetical protein